MIAAYEHTELCWWRHVGRITRGNLKENMIAQSLHLLLNELHAAVAVMLPKSPFARSPSSFRRILVRLKNALLDQLFWLGSVFHLFLQAVCAHVSLELSLLSLDCWSSIGVGKDVACGTMSG